MPRVKKINSTVTSEIGGFSKLYRAFSSHKKRVLNRAHLCVLGAHMCVLGAHLSVLGACVSSVHRCVS